MSGPGGASKTRRAKRDPVERVAAIEAELARVRAREERRLIRAADKAGFFNLSFSRAETEAMFRHAIKANAAPRRSMLARLRVKLVQARSRASKAARADDARRKALLGEFLVARCRQKPEVHTEHVPDIRGFLESHENAEVAARNVALCKAFLDNPNAPESGDMPVSETYRRRSHRLILLGAYVMTRHEDENAAIRRLLAEDLPGFVRKSRYPERHRQLLKAYL